MPTTVINKNNVFWIFAKILWLLDEVSEIKINYEFWDNEEEKPRFASRGNAGAYPRKFSRSEDSTGSYGKSYSDKWWSYGDRPKHTRGWSKFDWPTDDRKPASEKKTTNYKTTKFKAEKRWTAPVTTNKKWNPGKGYKKAWY